MKTTRKQRRALDALIYTACTVVGVAGGVFLAMWLLSLWVGGAI